MEATPQKLPKWFNGHIYKEGSIVENPFSKEKYELNNIELSIYDFIIGNAVVYELGAANNKMVSDMQKSLTWFRINNPEAYMALLD